jgi:hypothetical protein
MVGIMTVCRGSLASVQPLADSVLKQTSNQWRWVIVHDCSDGWGTLREQLGNDPRVSFLRDAGLSRKRGLDRLLGYGDVSLVLFADGGDCIDGSRLFGAALDTLSARPWLKAIQVAILRGRFCLQHDFQMLNDMGLRGFWRADALAGVDWENDYCAQLQVSYFISQMEWYQLPIEAGFYVCNEETTPAELDAEYKRAYPKLKHFIEKWFIDLSGCAPPPAGSLFHRMCGDKTLRRNGSALSQLKARRAIVCLPLEWLQPHETTRCLDEIRRIVGDRALIQLRCRGSSSRSQIPAVREAFPDRHETGILLTSNSVIPGSDFVSMLVENDISVRFNPQHPVRHDYDSVHREISQLPLKLHPHQKYEAVRGVDRSPPAVCINPDSGKVALCNGESFVDIEGLSFAEYFIKLEKVNGK